MGRIRVILKIFGKTMLAAAIFFVIMHVFQGIYDQPDTRVDQTVRGFYQEKKESLDMVLVGASQTYAAFQAPIAWNQYGVRCWNLSIPSMPCNSIRYFIREARKTQPNALYMISLNCFRKDTLSISSIHRLTDYLPMSLTKIQMIHGLCDAAKIPIQERAEFYFPLIRYHSSWSQKSPEELIWHSDQLKNGQVYKTFLNKESDVTDSFMYSTACSPMGDVQAQALSDLMDYLKAEHVKTVFLMIPEGEEQAADMEELNEAKRRVAEQHFDIIDLYRAEELLNLDLKHDYYNKFHMNVHGSIKFTNYLAAYLQENYELPDHREEPGQESWKEAYDRYMEILTPYVFDFEIRNDLRDRNLQEPKEITVEKTKDGHQISWSPVKEAEGYTLYRKETPQNQTDTGWIVLKEMDSSVSSFKDVTAAEQADPVQYAVVPWRENEANQKIYGSFDYHGIAAQSDQEENRNTTEDAEKAEETEERGDESE